MTKALTAKDIQKWEKINRKLIEDEKKRKRERRVDPETMDKVFTI